MRFDWQQLSPGERDVLLRHFLLKSTVKAPVTPEKVCAVMEKTHYLSCFTNEEGKASFKGKYLRSPKLFGWIGNVLSVATQGVHASFGPHAYVFAFGRGMAGNPVANGYVEIWTGSPEHMKSTIAVTPDQEPVAH